MGLVEAKKDISIEAKNINLGTIELYDYNKIGTGKNYTITESTTNIGSVLTGENVSLFAKKDLN